MGDRTAFDEYQQRLQEKDWSWDDVAPLHSRGREQSILPLHELDHLDVYERTYGRRFGANGIGRLREVALSRISDAENRLFEDPSPYAGEMRMLEPHGVGRRGLGRIDDIRVARAQQDAYAELLEDEGVRVRWISWEDDQDGPYGPLHAMWAAGEVLVLEGGAIVPKRGRDPFSFGRAEHLSRWLFWELNIPTLLTVAGTGIAEVGSVVWLAHDVFVVGDSIAYNEEGIAQVLPIVTRSTRDADLHVLTLRCQGECYFDPDSGAAAHVESLITPLDVDKVLCYSPGIDTSTLLWLERHGYEVVEAEFDDHVRHRVCNSVLLEPGRVVMPAEAERTVERVRRAGIDVREAYYGAFHAAGGGLHSATLQIEREPGPSRFASTGGES